MTMMERFGRKDVERAVPVQARDRRHVGYGPGTIRTATSGTLTFLAGESTERIEVSGLDDAHDKGEKTLLLSRPSSGRLTDGETTPTIENRDPLPREPLAQCGRTAAVHVIEHVEVRWQAPRVPGSGAGCAGWELRLTPIKWHLINKDAVDLREPLVGVARIAARAVGASRAHAWRERSDDAGR